MGITATGAAFLIEAHQQGVNFEDTLLLGRQDLCVSPLHLAGLLSRHGYGHGRSRRSLAADFCHQPYYADPLFHWLGARRLTALDASTFEGADIVHDLNVPIAEELHQRFDMVLDGGLLEHVFHFPVAMRNVMEMVKIGGHLLLMTPANNYFGHGFYQFSPELFFRVLSPENGFRIERLLAMENDVAWGKAFGTAYLAETSGPRYAVTDPAEIGGRNVLLTARPVMLLIQAVRTQAVPIFARVPQQSDYAAAWEGHQHREAAAAGVAPPKAASRRANCWRLHLRYSGLAGLMRRLVPGHYRRLHREWSFGNRRSYTPKSG